MRNQGEETVTILVTDVEGSTGLYARQGDEAGRALLAVHEDIVRRRVSEHGGTVVKSLGDGLLVTFASARRAITCAVQIQRDHEDHPTALRVRVALNSGEVLVIDGDVHGAAVSATARIAALTPPTRILAGDALRQVAGTVPAVDFVDRGGHVLRGFTDPVRLWEIPWRPAAAGDTPVPSADPALLEVRLAGRFTTVRQNTPLADHEVGSRKGRLLLKLLLVHAPDFVRTDRIIEVLWGESPPPHAEENVASLISRLRLVFGADVIRGGRGAYAFVPGARVAVDVEQAKRWTAGAEERLAQGEPALARVAADRALALLSDGRLLEEEADAPWAEDARREAVSLLRRARKAAWTASVEVGDRSDAVASAEAAIDADPLDEEAHRAVMSAHWSAGDEAAALAAYGRLRHVLAEELGAEPGIETERLYRAILRRETTPSRTVTGRGPTPAPPGDGEFVGRRAELEQLAAAWADAVERRPGLVVLRGEAGIGKTRLAQQATATAEASGGLVVTCRCYEAERSLLLQPVAEAIRAVVVRLAPERLAALDVRWSGALADLVPEYGRVVPGGSHQPGAPEAEYRRTFEAAASFLVELAGQQPVFLLVDDLQEAGSSTIEWLHFLAQRSAGARLLTVATVRAEECGEALEPLLHRARVVDVGPLEAGDVTELARRFGVEGVAEEVVRRTRGHTLFAVEALREAAAGPGGRVPSSLRDAVIGRVRRLGRDVERVLRAGVVVGAAFDPALVGELLGIGLDEAAARAEQALTGRLLVDAGAQYEFVNDLVREILYETTPGPTRVAYHRRLMSLLPGQPEAVGRHALAAGDRRAAVDAWLDAAARAAARFANRDAERVLTDALVAADDLGDPALLAVIHLARGRARENLGDYQGAYDDHLAALSCAGGDPDMEAQIRERLGWTVYYGRGALPREVTGRGIELAERAARAAGARASALALLARVRHSEGDVEGAEAALARAAAGECDPADRAQLLTCKSLLAMHLDRYDEAIAVSGEAAANSRAAGEFRTLTTALFSAGIASLNAGDFVGAAAHFGRMEVHESDFDDPLYRARRLTAQSWWWRELGDIGRASDLIDDSVASCAQAGALRSHPGQHALLGAAECALLRGDEAAAAVDLERTTPLDLPLSYQWRARLRWLELWSRLVPERAEELLEFARSRGSPKYEALALAHLGRHDEAASVAAKVPSDLLMATVAPLSQAQVAFERLAARLPADLRDRFLRSSRLAARLGTAE